MGQHPVRRRSQPARQGWRQGARSARCWPHRLWRDQREARAQQRADDRSGGHAAMNLPRNVVNMPVKLTCAECGSPANGACACGQPYLPPGMRALAAVMKQPMMSNTAIAEKIGVDEKTVRTARKKAGSEYSGPHAKALEGRLYKRRKRTRKRAARMATPKQQLIAFTREISDFVADFSLELTMWLDAKPDIERAGRESLHHTLEAYSQQLQRLAQRVQEGNQE